MNTEKEITSFRKKVNDKIDRIWNWLICVYFVLFLLLLGLFGSIFGAMTLGNMDINYRPSDKTDGFFISLDKILLKMYF